jgi:hypothetical protein
MVHALFRQLVLLVASLTTSAALMAVVVTVDGGAHNLGVLDARTPSTPVPVHMAQAHAQVHALAPVAR